MNEREAIRELYREYWRCMIAKDTSGLRALMAEDYTLTHMTGAVQTGEAFLRALLAGTFHYDSAEHDEIEVSVHGDTASMTGKSRRVISRSERETGSGSSPDPRRPLIETQADASRRRAAPSRKSKLTHSECAGLLIPNCKKDSDRDMIRVLLLFSAVMIGRDRYQSDRTVSSFPLGKASPAQGRFFSPQTQS